MNVKIFLKKKQASILAPKRVYISVKTDLCGDLDLLYFKKNCNENW